jgi:hypothetical protein
MQFSFGFNTFYSRSWRMFMFTFVYVMKLLNLETGYKWTTHICMIFLHIFNR